MQRIKLTAVSPAGRLGCLLLPLLAGCTGVIPTGPEGGSNPPGTTGGTNGGGGGGTGVGGTTGPASSKPEVDVMTIRRLNRTEYTNTLRALLGTAEDHGAKFPEDNLSFGFDNIGEALTVQPLHIEMFEQTAEAVLTELFARPAGDAARAKVLACDAQTGGHACVVSTVLSFAERAYRRPVTEAEITPFVSIADSYAQTGGTAADGLKLALQGVLLSPHFLYRVELDPSPTDKTPHRLNAFELASRLSYYLWSTMPDDALYADAKSGNLNTDSGLLTQVSRMMMDGKAQALTANFAGQWLNLRRMVNVAPDAAAYPAFDADLRAAMQTESSMFFAELFSQGRPISELLTSDFSFVNAKLAAFYGLPAPAGGGFERVQVGAANRAGFLTQASFLTLTSNPNRTSPVKRGKWVLDQLLCTPPPPPPMGADLNLPEGGTQSVRAKLEQHRAKEPCNTCHKIMDPIGLAFENFSGIGQYRTSDEYGPIDATGTLEVASGPVSFSNASQLIPILAADDRLTPCAAQKVLTYAVGRNFTADDATALNNIVAATNATGQGLRGLFGSAALSESFRSRRAVGE
jgi:hypothetical protein